MGEPMRQPMPAACAVACLVGGASFLWSCEANRPDNVLDAATHSSSDDAGTLDAGKPSDGSLKPDVWDPQLADANPSAQDASTAPSGTSCTYADYLWSGRVGEIRAGGESCLDYGVTVRRDRFARAGAAA